MKKLLSLALLVTFFSCDKKEPDTGVHTGNTNTGEKLPRWDIPNWRHGDTLGSAIIRNGQPVGMDTMYTYSEGTTAMIMYQGKKYYIWIQGTYKEEKLLPDQKSYTNCIISPTRNLEDAINRGVDCTISPIRYIDKNGLWIYQDQTIMFNGGIGIMEGTTYTKI